MTDMPVAAAARSDRVPLAPRGEVTELPMSFAQEQLWFIDEFHHGLPAHNLPYLVRVRGPLDAAALDRALDAVTARHEALRTRLLAGPDGRGVQLVDPPAPGRLGLTDFAALDPETAAGRLRQLAAAEALLPFHLAQGRLLRARLARLAADEHVLVLVAHRTVFDDWSFGVLLRELVALYAAQVTAGPSGLPDRRAQLADYALWQRRRLAGPELARLENFWRGALSGFETTQFPSDRPRPLFASHDGAVETAVVSPAVLAGLRELSRQAGTTLPVTLLAALQVLLHRYTGQTDLVVGVTSPARTEPGLESLIGFVANMLPVRCDVCGDPAFTELVQRVAAAHDDARAHQDLPFARIVETLGVDRDTGRFPVFQIGFGYAEPAAPVESAGLVFQPEPAELHASMYDLYLAAEPAGAGLRLQATYTPALFDPAMVSALLGHLRVLLAGVVADPGARLSRLPVLTGAELRRELAEWNDTAAEFPAVCIHEGFEVRAARSPGAVAAQFGGEELSYRELDAAANRVAGRLREAGVGPETLVGVCMGTGLRRLAVLLGVWKAGGGYVPLDPGLPADRLGFLLADTGMPVVVADTAGAAAVPARDGVTVVALDQEWDQVCARPGTAPAGPGASPHNVAYVIYTSGSTGQPKGVVVEHRQAINFLQGMGEIWGIGPGSAVLGFAAFTFDVSVMDMFMPLLGGGKVVLAAAETLHSPPRLAELIRSAGVTFACLPPAVLNLLTGEEFPGLRALLSAGEELSSELLRAWLRPGLRIFNGYGPTEASIGATFMSLDPGTPLPPPIGRPKPNYQVYVLDPDLNPVPPGVTGELHIGGAGVARGYLNRPELTRERFIADPFRAGGRLYKTGDLVRRRRDGTIVFVGRADDQVKIRGLRIELGEIETVLAAHPAVAQAVVTVVTGPAGDQQLAAYLRAAPGAGVTAAELRQHLASQLPGYLVPAHLVIMDQLPLTAHGKIDKAALPAPQAAQPAAGLVPPRTLLETAVADFYATVLGIEQVGATDSFFDLGGNSLQAMRLITQLRTSLAVDLDITAVFLAPTPRRLGALLRDKHGFDDADLADESLESLRQTSGQAS